MKKTTLTLDDAALARLQGALRGAVSSIDEAEPESEGADPWEWGEAERSALEHLLERVYRARGRCRR